MVIRKERKNIERGGEEIGRRKRRRRRRESRI
jgi:hypothetical protein